jgi:hypothetical protein
MDSSLKKKLRALSLALRHTLEGSAGQSGDLENRLNQMGVWRDRAPKPAEELQLSPQDLAARRVVDAFLQYREEAGVSRRDAFAEFVRESAYSWANRLFMLRCLESRGLIDEVVLQKEVYGGRSLVHHRFAQQNPAACAGEDDGLFDVLEAEFRSRAAELPTVFDPQAPAISLRPSVSALKRCVGLLSGTVSLNGQGAASDDLFEAGDAPGWAYQFWNAEEKDRVFEKVRTQKGAKIEGADLIPATQLYTEPYMVKFLVQNSLGALWAGMYPETKLTDGWEYYVRDADRTPPVQPDPPPFDPAKPPQASKDPWIRPNPKLCTEADIRAYARTLAAKVPAQELDSFAGLRNQLLDAVERHDLTRLVGLNQMICDAWDTEWPARRPKLRKKAAELTFLDPACGSGHFLLEAFDLLYSMYEEEGILQTPEEICASILNNNLFGMDIDERAIQISIAALWMHAMECALQLRPDQVTGLRDNVIAANLSLPRGRAHLEEFLAKHPEDADLRPALEAVFRGLADANQLGTLLRIEEPVELELQRQKDEEDRRSETVLRQSQATLDFMTEQYVLAARPTRDYESWRHEVLERLKNHFRQEATLGDRVQVFFGREALQGLSLFDLLARRYDAVVTNPPYLGAKKLSENLKTRLQLEYKPGRNDLMTAFFIRLNELRSSVGIVAFVSSAAFMWLQLHEDIRDYLLEHLPVTVAVHLGYFAFEELGDHVDGVLYVSQPNSGLTSSWYRLNNAGDKPEGLKTCVRSTSGDRFILSRIAFDRIPGRPFVYSQATLLESLYSNSALLATVAPARSGLQTSEIDRFVRCWWEVPYGSVHRWRPYVKGGDSTPWHELDTYAVDWQCDGTRIKSEALRRYGSVTRTVKNQDFYFKPGLTFSLSSGHDFSVRKLGQNYIFDVSSPTVFTEDNYSGWVFAYLNSSLAAWIVRLLNPTMHVTVNDLARLPVPEVVSETKGLLGAHAERAHDLTRALVSLRPSSNQFRPEYLLGRRPDEVVVFAESIAKEIEELEDNIDRTLETSFCIPEGVPTKRRVIPLLVPTSREVAEWTVAGCILHLLGHKWPSSSAPNETPDSIRLGIDGIIPITDCHPFGTPLLNQVSRLASEQSGSFPLASLERSTGYSASQWLEQQFFPAHVRRFGGRPIAWQIQTRASNRGEQPVFSCMLHYGRVADAIPSLRSRFAGALQATLEVEQRTLEHHESLSVEQSLRKAKLVDWIEELSTFRAALERIEASGFATAALRVDAILDAVHSLARYWLTRLKSTLGAQPLQRWQIKAQLADLHLDLPSWVAEAVEHVDRQCVAIAPEVPASDTPDEHLSPAALAELFRGRAPSMIRTALEAICREWQSQFDKALIQPLREQMKAAEEEYKSLEDNIENKLRRKDLKSKVKALKAEIAGLAAKSGALAAQIQEWRCPEAETWVEWLATQPLYDEFASLDGRRPPPKTVAEFVSQESQYAPDLNDGVRVNIAPLQKAGILARDVLAPKDVDKAIADRAEWRADERRWCRQGILPQPGWWIDSDGVAFHQQPQEKPIPERSM